MSDDSTSAVFFNAHHSPIGAFASFTLGSRGATGGFGIEIGGPANEDVFIGIEDAEEPGKYLALPFFSALPGSDAREFDAESLSGLIQERRLEPFRDSEVSRQLSASIDEWTAGDLRLRIISPIGSIPDPDTDAASDLKRAFLPAVLVELTVDNRKCSRSRKAFFGYAGSGRSRAMRSWSQPGLSGISQGATSVASQDPGVYSGVAFQPESVLDPIHEANLAFLLGKVGLLVGMVSPGEVRSFRFAVSFFKEGNVTAGLESRYLYGRYFQSPEEVLTYALDQWDDVLLAAETFDRRLEHLPEERRLMLAQAIRSYYGSTQCLELQDGSVTWIVNEGEYRMMNTLDLLVDQMFFELEMNPWTVRNQLDLHRERGMYYDTLGVAFTHDLGVANTFAEPGRSAYEQSGLSRCFSYMSCEELVNWTLAACTYGLRTQDRDWLEQNAGLLGECLQSLSRRDSPNPTLRNGVMSYDSDRCEGGSEITTYDSLDASLGQARGSTYLAVKTWAAYILLGCVFDLLNQTKTAAAARSQARLCADTVATSADSTGLLPAVIGEEVEAQVIPVIEGLAFVAFAGLNQALSADGPYGCLIAALREHLRTAIASGACRFSGGGWRLSSTSRNSWLSKTYMCQFVAERLFGLAPDHRADRAHLSWLMSPDNAYFAWSDQMLEGVAVGSRYYPRGVTAYLWLTNAKQIAISSQPSLVEATR